MTDPIWVDDQQREWFPDPAGRAVYRGRLLGMWTDVVADQAWAMSTDPVGGAALRGEPPQTAAPVPAAVPAQQLPMPQAVRQIPTLADDRVGRAIEAVGKVFIWLSLIGLVLLGFALAVAGDVSLAEWIGAMAVPMAITAGIVFQSLLLMGFGRMVCHQKATVGLLQELASR